MERGVDLAEAPPTSNAAASGTGKEAATPKGLDRYPGIPPNGLGAAEQQKPAGMLPRGLGAAKLLKPATGRGRGAGVPTNEAGPPRGKGG